MAKTERLAVPISAQFADAIHPPRRLVADEQTPLLTALVAHRRRLLHMLTGKTIACAWRPN
ncbi:MAG: hypothetical protein NNA22_06415 [Nitrospira sp.]|nr:hypothetical protein [Nitrospira sp.]